MGTEPAVGQPLLAPSWGRPLFWLNTVVAWMAVGLSLYLNLTGYYVDMIDPGKTSILGNDPGGIDSPLERFLDWSTYFTILSNLVVAVTLTALVARPSLFTRDDATGLAWRTLRLDGVLMIVITGLVYNLLLADGSKTGADAVSNTLLHWLVPLLTLLVWVVAGPRGLISLRIIGLALILPLAWAMFALVRGAAVSAYPYPFLDASANGLGSVLVFITAIVILAILLALLLMAVDAGLRWTLERGRGQR